MRISSNFDGGSITVLACERPEAISLALRPDAGEFYQWFYFRVTGARGLTLTMTITNAHLSNASKGLVGMPEPWSDYQAMASVDLETWFRLDTAYDGRQLVIRVTPATDSLYIANFAPHSQERHRRLLGRAALSPRVALSVLGTTPDGNDLDLVRIGTPGGRRKVCWLITRQHPAETQGSWCLEGVIERLLDSDDPLVANLLERAVFCIVPNMNPDGSQRGYTRTNALGANLNRYWVDPRPELAPETLMVKQAIEQTGIDFLLDVHAWAGTHNYAVGPHHIPSQTARQIALWQRYEAALAAADRHFQVGWPYPGGGPAPGQADLAMSWNYVSETWGALGLLYELMFKEDAQSPDPAEGWGPNKCRQFGRHTLEAIAAIVDDLG